MIPRKNPEGIIEAIPEVIPRRVPEVTLGEISERFLNRILAGISEGIFE